MTEIKSLCEKIYSGNNNRAPKQFIDLYEENKTLIESEDLSISDPDYDGIMRLTSDYALSLSQYGSSKKALPYLDKAIQLFKNSSTEDLTKISMYETLVWARGVENYNNKKYKLASQDFQYLVDTYPDNDKYRNWLFASKTIKAKKWLNFLWGGVIVCVVWQTRVNKEDLKLKYYLLIAAIILFILAIVIEILNALLKTKIKEK